MKTWSPLPCIPTKPPPVARPSVLQPNQLYTPPRRQDVPLNQAPDRPASQTTRSQTQAPRQPLTTLTTTESSTAQTFTKNSFIATAAKDIHNFAKGWIPHEQAAALWNMRAKTGFVSSPAQAQADMRATLTALKANPDNFQLQFKANRAIKEASNQFNTFLSTLASAAHLQGLIAVGGTALTFGVGYGTGNAMASVLTKCIFGLGKPALDDIARTAAQTPGAHTVVNALLLWFLGSTVAGFCHQRNQHWVKPLMDLSPLQRKPIEVKAISTAKTCKWLNKLEQKMDAGEQLRVEVQQLQNSILKLNSAMNIKLGQAAFVTCTAIRFGLQGNAQLGELGIVGRGTAVSFAAGVLIAGGIAANASLLTAKVYDKKAMKHAVRSGQPASTVKTINMPVTYVEHQSFKTRLEEVRAFKEKIALRDPQGSRITTASNIAADVFIRTKHMAKATVGLGLAYMAKPFVTAALPGSPELTTAVNTILLSCALYYAVPKWFKAAVEDIPREINEMRQINRQTATQFEELPQAAITQREAEAMHAMHVATDEARNIDTSVPTITPVTTDYSGESGNRTPESFSRFQAKMPPSLFDRVNSGGQS
jgi:hypothetical protein